MNTLQYLNSLDYTNSVRTLTEARTQLYKIGVCWTDEVNGDFENNDHFRVVLFNKSNPEDVSNPILYECNGLVLLYEHKMFKALAIPLPAISKTKLSMKKVNDLYNAGVYELYEVLDATMLNLYYYNNAWRLSSTRGYDVGDITMFKIQKNNNPEQKYSYMNVFLDLIHKKYTMFNFDQLNKSHCYTVSLRHSMFHVFDESKHLINRTKKTKRFSSIDANSYIIVMNVVDTISLSNMPKNVNGLPHQQSAYIKSYTFGSIVNYASKALEKYQKGYLLNEYKYKPLYGYILRAVNKGISTEYKNIFIESSLYKYLRVGLYSKSNNLTNGYVFGIVAQLMTQVDKFETYKIMFQQYNSYFEKVFDLIKQIEDNELVVEKFKDAPKNLIRDVILNNQDNIIYLLTL